MSDELLLLNLGNVCIYRNTTTEIVLSQCMFFFSPHNVREFHYKEQLKNREFAVTYISTLKARYLGVEVFVVVFVRFFGLYGG